MDDREAERDLRHALGDGVVSARFGSDYRPGFRGSFFNQHPQRGAIVGPEVWSNCEIVTENGGYIIEAPTARDTDNRRARTVFINRPEMLETWPLAVSKTAGTSPQPEAAQPVRIRTATAEQIRACITKLYDRTGPAPNVEQSYRLVSVSLRNDGLLAPRVRVRDVLAEPEFAKRRLLRGMRKAR